MTDANGAPPAGVGSGENDGEEATRGGLTIARYGEVMAHVRYFPRAKKGEVLARLGVDEDDWDEAVSSWTDALADASEREDEGLSRQFGLAVAQTKERLVREKPPVASLGPLPGEGEEEPATAQALPPGVEPSAPLAPPQPAEPNPNFAPPPPGLVASPAPPAPVAPAFVMPEGMKHWSYIQGTQLAPMSAPEKPALPFVSGEPGDRSSPPPHAAAPAEVPPPLRPAAPPVGGETRDISSVVAAVMAQRSPLPFDSRTDAPANRVSAPPAYRPTVAAPALTLEQYASLCVEIAAAPARMAEISMRYGLTDEQRGRADAYWRARMAAEPEVAAAWNRAYATYRQWLSQR
jgi:hypothetical protein